jgi:ATP-dependent exoDNAse (exonuclease V) beta subunit
MKMNIQFISAGAGSGKTYRLTQELSNALFEGSARPKGVIATTFTVRAANELRERVREYLIEKKANPLANQLGQALISTVNSICGQLVQRFCFEAGLSPDLNVVSEADSQILFNQSLEAAINLDTLRTMNAIAGRFELSDWRTEVKAIADAARANNMASDTVRTFGKQSADELLRFFVEPTKSKLNVRLTNAIEKAINGIDANDDTTKGTAGYLKYLKSTQAKARKKRLSWSDWVALTKMGPTKKSQYLASPVRDVAGQYESHPDLQRDIRHFCETLFSVAADALDGFQTAKQSRGLIDFVDQENLLLNTLDCRTVKQTLAKEIDLLLVDEFQDSSPIELALFIKLAQLARTTIFVGDIKQAIYGFRGTDSTLMYSVIRQIESNGSRIDVLPYSWRSRPSLVNYVNKIFVPAFDSLPETEKVSLLPKRKEIAKQTAVEAWVLEGKNKASISASLATGIHRLVKSGHLVFDKGLGQTRPVRYGDIAILARTQSNVAQLADTLSSIATPIKIARAGLLSTPEVCLALACLRRLHDRSDTLASAEIISLSDCCPPETWLEDRLAYLASGSRSNAWGEKGNDAHPVLHALSEQRPRLKYLIPTEALSLAISTGEVRRTAVSWGPSPSAACQRTANIDALLNLAETYEEHCRNQHLASTVGGMLLWFMDAASDGMDMQALDAHSDAVHVLTHHSAKGLEWPVVVLTDLEGSIWSRLWSLNVVADNKHFSLRKPLKNRRLRFWPKPFGKHRSQVMTYDKVSSSTAAMDIEANDIAEHIRLLYVSFTRAKDLIVLGIKEKTPTGPWIETLNCSWLEPQGDTLNLPGGSKIRTAKHKYAPSDSVSAKKNKPYRMHWYGPNRSRNHKLSAYVNPCDAVPTAGATIAETLLIGHKLEVGPTRNQVDLGNGIHMIIAAEVINPGRPDALSITEGILNSYDLLKTVTKGDALAYTQKFVTFINKRFTPEAVFAEYPVQKVAANGQMVKGWIDLLIKTKNGWVIIDHKLYSGNSDSRRKKALEYSGQLQCYRDVVMSFNDVGEMECYIHFPLYGELIAVKS